MNAPASSGGGAKITDWELSERLGYADPYYFSQRFRQLIGITPRQFRASWVGRKTL